MPEDSAPEAAAHEDSAPEDSAPEASAPEASAPEASAPDDSTPEDSIDLDLMLDLSTPWCLRVAATLRLPEHIAAGHSDIGELAAVAGCDQDALHAVLGHLVSQGVFAEESPGRFSCNRAAEQLAKSRFIDLNGIGGRMAHTWGRFSTTFAPASRPTRKFSGGPFGRTSPRTRRSRRTSTR
jgi:hypothetical protein